tara:strand:- start:584 stop:1657 length:1074 start_codon:yes stop_codon:yes gene_type:complete
MDSEVLFDISDGVGTMILNRPKALNALTMEMIDQIRTNFSKWIEQDNIKVVIIKGAGDRAFCAGGDVRAVRQSIIEYKGSDASKLVQNFFYEEYILNYQIHSLVKPYLAFIDRVCMGGGVGLSVHGSHRIATERTLVGMPETTIGLFPDVGGAWFLSRLPGETGTYLALTGAPIRGGDCLALGIATHLVRSENLYQIETELHRSDLNHNAHAKVNEILGKYVVGCDDRPIFGVQPKIDKCFSADSVEEIIDRLREDKSEFGEQALEMLASKSPTSLKVTLEQIRRGARASNFAETMQMEYRMSQHFSKGHDFPEGVRALLVDKDHQPRWKPDKLEDISEELVQSYFERVHWRELTIL